MKRHLIYIFFLMISLSSNRVLGQDKDVRRAIESALTRYLPTRGYGIFDTDKYKNKAYLIGMAIDITQQGKIDTVIFSNATTELDSLMNFNAIRKVLRGKEAIFKKYKNHVLVTSVLIRREWDNEISSVKEFSSNFNGLTPDISKLPETRKVKLLNTFNMTQVKRKP